MIEISHELFKKSVDDASWESYEVKQQRKSVFCHQYSPIIFNLNDFNDFTISMTKFKLIKASFPHTLAKKYNVAIIHVVSRKLSN